MKTLEQKIKDKLFNLKNRSLIIELEMRKEGKRFADYKQEEVINVLGPKSQLIEDNIKRNVQMELPNGLIGLFERYDYSNEKSSNNLIKDSVRVYSNFQLISVQYPNSEIKKIADMDIHEFINLRKSLNVSK